MPSDTTELKTNGARDVVCFYCRNCRHVEGAYAVRAGGGFHHQSACVKGLHQPDSVRGVPDIEIVLQCPGGEPRFGFQIGGYYSHAWFEDGQKVPCDPPCGSATCHERDCQRTSSCMELVIASDGEFPTDDPADMMQFHLCDFHQLERFVEFWGKELRRRGWVRDQEQKP